MNDIVYFEGVKATVRQTNFRLFSIAFLAVLSIIFSAACKSAEAPNSGGTTANPGDAAASVNGKAIKMEEVERVIKQQGQGQEAKLSPLELADARLKVLEGLIQQEVMFQKAEKEGLTISDEDVTAEFNKAKQQSGLSAEAFDKKLQEAGQTEASARETIKKSLAIQKLVDKISSKVEPPKDGEIESFYTGNKDAFVKKRGVKLAAIVVDPANNGEGDTTKNEADAVLKGNEIIKQLQQGVDFATVAREKSEDNSRLQGGDLGNISEEEMKQTFPPQVAAALMNPKFAVGQILPTPMQGKFYIFKLQERIEQDEALTLESPGVRQKITESLINARKNLLSQSYAAIAMNEAKIENNLAKRVIDNPNDLSGARPAVAANANGNSNPNASVTANVNTNANAANVNTKPAANTSAVKPGAKPPVASNATAPTANVPNANANK